MTIVYSAECKASQKAAGPAVMLPILVVLFLFSYALLTLLVFEQGRTIESQRGLIRDMLQDSTQLAALKGKLARDEHAHRKPSAPAAPRKSKSAAAPKGKDAKPSGKSSHSLKQAPEKPASDSEDVRRATGVT